MKPNDTNAALPVRSLLASMERGDSIDFLYAGGGGTPFRWRIAGYVRDRASADQAMRRAGELQQALTAVLERSNRIYRFQPVSPELPLFDESEVGLWVGHVQCQGVPMGAAPARGKIGFGDDRAPVLTGPGAVLLPRNPLPNPRAFDSLAELVTCSPVPVQLALSISPVVLDPAQLNQVRNAIHWLESAPELVRAEGEFSELDLMPGTIRTAWRETLVKWLETGSGLRLACSTFSEEAMPGPFLEMLGREIFPGLVTTSIEEPGRRGSARISDAAAPNALDLLDCFVSADSLPALFPSVAALTKMKSRRFYNAELPALSDTGLSLGFIKEGALQREVRFADVDRDRHGYIIGASGTGKTTLLFNMILDDIRRGNGVGLIDPHGDLYQEVLAAIPRHRAKDIVLFDPCDHDHAVGLNFLECTAANRSIQINYIINELLRTLDRIYDMRAAGGPIFETYFRNALMLLLESGLPGVTLLEFQAVFGDKDFRQFLKRRCRDPFTTKFWTDIAEKAGGESRLADVAPYITSKLNLFTQNAVLRPIIGQAQTTIDFRQIMDSRKILLVNLSKGILGESDAQLLGMLLIGQLFGAVMGRATLAPERRVPFSLFVDEFQNFTTDTVAHLLSEARKFGLRLTLANQNLGQLAANKGTQNLVDAVLGNVGSLILFRLGAPDAEKMRLYTRPEFSEEDLQDLPNFHAIGRILTQRGPTRPFVFQTHPKSSAGANKLRSLRALKARQATYAKPIAEVEAAIAKRQRDFQEAARRLSATESASRTTQT